MQRQRVTFSAHWQDRDKFKRSSSVSRSDQLASIIFDGLILAGCTLPPQKSRYSAWTGLLQLRSLSVLNTVFCRRLQLKIQLNLPSLRSQFFGLGLSGDTSGGPAFHSAAGLECPFLPLRASMRGAACILVPAAASRDFLQVWKQISPFGRQSAAILPLH